MGDQKERNRIFPAPGYVSLLLTSQTFQDHFYIRHYFVWATYFTIMLQSKSAGEIIGEKFTW